MPEPRPWPCPLPPEGLPDGTAYFEQDGWEWYADSTAETGVSCRVIPGGVADVESTIRDRAQVALDFLQPKIHDWDTLTPAQKDQTMLVVAKSTAGLLRVLLCRFEEAGD